MLATITLSTVVLLVLALTSHLLLRSDLAGAAALTAMVSALAALAAAWPR